MLVIRIQTIGSHNIIQLTSLVVALVFGLYHQRYTDVTLDETSISVKETG